MARYEELDPPLPVFVHGGPGLAEHTNRFPQLIRNIASLLPGNRPKNLAESLYFRKHPNPGITVQRCQLICDLIDSIISDGVTTTNDGWNYRDANGNLVEHTHKTWCGPIGFIVGTKQEFHFCDGHHRKTICCLLNVPFPAYLVAVYKNWKGQWKSQEWLNAMGIHERKDPEKL